MTTSGAGTERAPAKINLFLHVTGRRPDGYHLLDSLAVFGGAADSLTATPDDALSLRLTGPFGAALAADPDNLVLRAARALREAAGNARGAALVLDKMLPVASGIGGGSADAAAALRLLARLWDVPAAIDLAPLAAKLGADVPVCLAGRPARMGGIGERLLSAPVLPPCGIVLVNPGVPLATPAVFRARSGPFGAPAALPDGWADAGAMCATLEGCRNDLEEAAIALCPEIAVVLAVIRASDDCLLSRMSGSGATCFGLFADAEAAREAASRLARPGWWCWGGALRHRV